MAVPAGFGDDGLPFGVSLIASAFSDDALSNLAAALHHAGASGLGADRSAAILPPAAPSARPAPADDVVIGVTDGGEAGQGYGFVRLGASVLSQRFAYKIV